MSQDWLLAQLGVGAEEEALSALLRAYPFLAVVMLSSHCTNWCAHTACTLHTHHTCYIDVANAPHATRWCGAWAVMLVFLLAECFPEQHGAALNSYEAFLAATRPRVLQALATLRPQ